VLKERGHLFHYKNTVRIKNFHCDFLNCHKAFRYSQEKKDHIASVHRGEKNHVCEICLKAFKLRKSLKLHVELEHNERASEDLPCTDCGEVFPSKAKLYRHKGTHRVYTKKFLCKFCDYKTHANILLIEHQRTHTGVKPEICGWCGKGFSAKKTLRNHERLHTGEKPFKCQQCHAGFTQRTGLISHIKSQHKDVTETKKGSSKAKKLSRSKPAHARKTRANYEVHSGSEEVIKNDEEYDHDSTVHSKETGASEGLKACTGLKCKLCGKEFDDVESLASHRRVCNSSKKGKEM